jgi:site-specific recombinase XerD
MPNRTTAENPMDEKSPTTPKNEIAQVERRLTKAEFQGLAEMPAEVEWFRNLDSLNTSESYQVDLRNFMEFLGIEQAEEFREVTRAHVIAWRDHLGGQDLAGSTIRRKLSAVSSLFEYRGLGVCRTEIT